MPSRDMCVLLFDGVQSLDVAGPVEVFTGADRYVRARHVPAPGYRVTTAALGGGAVRISSGLRITPDTDLVDAPVPPTLVVPGGEGTRARQPELADWLRAHAHRAQRLVSVCTGAFLLAAAGLLDGRRATTHWLALDQLPALGAVATEERVVTDGKYVTAAGVSSGIDMALTLAARLADAATARMVQLGIEYDPRPPFTAGSPATAPPEEVEVLRTHRRLVLRGA